MRILKEFGNSFLRNASIKLMKLKIKPPPTIRENGISITIRVKNEIDWIEYCLLSFQDFADEIIITDRGSTDGSVEIIQNFMKTHPNKQIKFFDRRNDSYLEVSNFDMQQTKYRWIMRVDADHIAHTSGIYNILKLKKRILNLDPNYFYAIHLYHVNLFLDFFHTVKNYPRHKEMWLYTYSPDVFCIRKGRYSDVFWIPIYYKYLDFVEPFVYHVNLRPKMRLLERKYWTSWFLEGKEETLEAYIKRKIQEDFLTDSLNEAAEMNLKLNFKEAGSFNASLYGDYPEVIRPLIKNPNYKIIYDEKGEMKTRIEPNYKG